MNAYYICAPAGAEYGAYVFRRLFSAKGMKNATLHITALGVYEAHINGRRVGKYILAPGWTQYESRLQVQTYDVSDLIQDENTIDITVGKGWYASPLGWLGDEGVWGRTPAVIASLDITFTDGHHLSIPTDTRWTVSASKIRRSEIYYGEDYDENFQLDFKHHAVKLLHPKSILIPQEGEEIREREVIENPQMILTPKGETVLDFGQESVGYIEVSGILPKGTLLEYDHGEVLDSHGNFYNANLRSAAQKIRYIANGESFVYKPHFTFMGFRYIRLSAGAEYMDKLKFRLISVYSDMKRTGYFECSNEKINRLYQNILWSQRSNFLDIPTDCPQRDERCGWFGDAQVFSATAAYNYDVRKFFRKWLHDVKAAQYENGDVPHIAPNFIFNDTSSEIDPIDRPACGWGDASVIIPWRMYTAYGDRGFLEDQFDSMKAYVDFMRAGAVDNIWAKGDCFGDWLALDHPKDYVIEESWPGMLKSEGEQDPYIGYTDMTYLCTAFYAYSTSILIKAGDVLNKDMTEYKKLYSDIRKAFNAKFVHDGRIYRDTQTAYAIALVFDLVDDKPVFAARLAELIRQNGNKLSTGVLGTPYLLPALSQNGYHELAYHLLLQEEFPSWLYSVNAGATTIWEHWDSRRPNGAMWSTDMNSFNHYSLGSVAQWMYSYMGGIQPDEAAPGWENIKIAPAVDSRMDWVKVSYDTDTGTVTSSWKKEDGRYRYEITVPAGHTADITLNGETTHVEAGTYHF